MPVAKPNKKSSPKPKVKAKGKGETVTQRAERML